MYLVDNERGRVLALFARGLSGPFKDRRYLEEAFGLQITSSF